MREILRGLRDKNRSVRVVAVAVTMETIFEIMQAMGEIPGGEVDIIQLNIAKTRTIQEYHIIGALNPIFLATIRFDGKIA